MRIRAVHMDGAVTELDNVEQLYFMEGEGNCGVCEECKEETITEFADRCKECGSRYGKLLKDLATERTGHCKDCKWWKDSDGVSEQKVNAL